MEYNVRLEQLSSRPLAVVRRRTVPQQLSKVIPDACGTVWGVIRSQQVAGAGRHIAVYPDGELNLEVGVELDAKTLGTVYYDGSEVFFLRTPMARFK